MLAAATLAPRALRAPPSARCSLATAASAPPPPPSSSSLASLGYSLVAHRHLPARQLDCSLLRHDRTGAQHLHVASATDNNNCFSVHFQTTPTNSTGVAHVLEHTVLCGSQQFPVRFCPSSGGQLRESVPVGLCVRTCYMLPKDKKKKKPKDYFFLWRWRWRHRRTERHRLILSLISPKSFGFRPHTLRSHPRHRPISVAIRSF